MRRTILLLASVAVAMILASGTAFALLTFASGGSIERIAIARETTATNTNAVAYNDVPGASVPVSVPAGSSRLIMARFSAESACNGGAGAQYCSVRIVAVNVANGAITELSPQSGMDFAFDSTDLASETFASWESHSMDRSERLREGNYRIKVQRAVTNAAVTFRLDDYSLTVETAQ
jgi:hypothetical protein